MYRTALAVRDELPEVSVSSIEILETNVVAIRDELKEFKADYRDNKAEVRAALARIDNEIKTSVVRLETEIRAMARKAEDDLRQFSDRMDAQYAELRAENKYLREKMDSNYEKLNARIDATNLDIKDLTKIVLKIDSRLSAIQWCGAGVIAVATVLVTVGKAFHWF